MNLHRRGRRRKAEPAFFSPAREKKPSRGRGLAGLGQGSAAARAARRRRAHPLGSTRAGEGAGDGAMAASLHRPLFRLLVTRLRLRCAEEKRERGDERERAPERMKLGFSHGRAASGFLTERNRRLAVRCWMNGQD